MLFNKPGWRPTLFTLLVIVLSLATIGSASAAQFPDVIPLPNGFRPEGIAVGTGSTFYVGSIPTGAVYRGDLRTGEGEVLVPAQSGRAAIGLKYDERTGLLFVAGGPTGFAFVYDGETGESIAAIQLTTLPSLQTMPHISQIRSSHSSIEYLLKTTANCLPRLPSKRFPWVAITNLRLAPSMPMVSPQPQTARP
jgi:hypothetical protein